MGAHLREVKEAKRVKGERRAGQQEGGLVMKKGEAKFRMICSASGDQLDLMLRSGDSQISRLLALLLGTSPGG